MWRVGGDFDTGASYLQDSKGLNDTATVLINVEDYDNLNPYFIHSLYEAFIPENQVTAQRTPQSGDDRLVPGTAVFTHHIFCVVFQIGMFRLTRPEMIKAQDGDVGINVSLSYSISAGKS